MQKMWRGLFQNIHQSYFLVTFCVGVIGGMIIGLVFRINYFGSPLWIVFVILVAIVIYIKPKLLFAGMALIAGSVMAFYRVATELVDQDYIRQYYGQTVLIVGRISGDPEKDEKGTKVVIADLQFGGEEYGDKKGSIYITLRTNEEIERGDKIVIEGKLENGFGTYVGYLYQPKLVKHLKPDPPDLVLTVRNSFADRIKEQITEPQANLGLSYLLGMKTNLPDELATDLRIVGLVHIVVASGTHLSILVEIAKKVFGKLSRFAGLLFSGLFVVFFMAMVGFTPSIMRAGIMSLFTIIAWYVGRKFEPWRIILIVAAFTLMMQPMYLINLGWLLSFSSFFGIMILGPLITQFLYGEKKPGFIGGMIITTLSATIMTLPLSLYYYGTISLISFVANLLILPTLPYVMGLVFASGVVSGVLLVENVVSFVATKMLDYHIFVVESLSKVTSLVIEIEPYQPWVFSIYGVVGMILLIGLLRRKMVKLREVRNNNLE